MRQEAGRLFIAPLEHNEKRASRGKALTGDEKKAVGTTTAPSERV